MPDSGTPRRANLSCGWVWFFPQDPDGELDVLQLGLALLQCALLRGHPVGRAFTSSRGTQTQAIVADAASNEDRDAAFSLYFLLGFLSQPFWVPITGLLMDNAGFATALTVLSATYIVGTFLLGFMRDERPIAMPVQ